MKAINIQPTKWSNFPDVDSVLEFSDDDAHCLRELRDVLKKHDCLERFGITLLHTHFEIGEDEILLETTNVQERTQIIQPVKAKDYQGAEFSLMTTSLKLVEGDSIGVQYCTCSRNKDGHSGGHASV